MANYQFSNPNGSTKRVTFPTHLMSIWLGQFYPTQVLVPAAVLRELIQFDFRSTIATVPELKGLTENGLTAIVNLLMRQFTTLETTDFESYLKNTGMSDLSYKEPGGKEIKLDAKTVTNLYDTIVKQATQSGISTLYLRDALMADLGDFKIDSEGMTWTNLITAVQDFQSIYARLTQSIPGGELVPEMVSTAEANPVIRFVYAIRRLMNQSVNPSIPARLSYVVDNIHHAMFGDSWLHKDTVIDGLEYRLTPNPWMQNEMSYETASLAYIAMLRSWMGFTNVTETYNVSPTELANSLTEGMGQLVPAIPSMMRDKADWNALIQPGQTNNLILRIWLTMVIMRVTSNEPSMTASRATSLMDFRKYRQDEYTAMLEEMLQVFGIVVDAYLDTAVFFRDLVDSQRLFFKTHVRTRAMFSRFINHLIEPYKTFSTPQTSPRYIKEGAHLITHNRPLSNADMEPALRDEDRLMINPVLVNLDSGERKEWRHAEILTGSLLNIETPLTLSVYLQLAGTYDPIYITKLQTSNFLNEHDLFKSVIGIVPLDELITKSHISKIHLTRGSLHYALTVQDFAAIFELPLELATYKFKKPGMYWKADSIADAIFWVGGTRNEKNYLKEVNVYYVDEVVIDDERRLESFAAIHPLYLDLTSEIGIDKKVSTFKTDLPANIEIAKSTAKKNSSTPPKEEMSVPIQKEEDVPEEGATQADPITSNQLEERQTSKGSYRKGKSQQTQSVEATDGPPKDVEPKEGFEWTQDKNSGKWIQTKKK